MSNIYDALNKNRRDARGHRRGAVGAGVQGVGAPGDNQEAQRHVRQDGSRGNGASAMNARGGASGLLPGQPDPTRDRELEALRQRILLEIGAERTPILFFTGAVPGEGATTLALHFALDLADGDQGPVLLIDGDLERSTRSLTGALQKSGTGRGLSDFLADGEDPGASILTTELPNLHFLPCGGNSTPPSELVRPERVESFLRELSEHYSCVIIDGGASLQAPETALLASATDGVVLVVRANRTRREVVQRAIHVLRKGHCRVLGVVLNDRRYPIPEFLYRRI